MSKDASFDIVSNVDMQEVDNAVNQTSKEISQRYDFKNSKSKITIEGEELKIVAENQYKLDSVIDILQTKLLKRNVSIKSLDYGKVDEAGSGLVRQIIKVKQGIETEKAKQIVKDIKNLKLKVQAQINDDVVRVSGKNRDDLQGVIQLIKENNYDIDLQFLNFR